MNFANLLSQLLIQLSQLPSNTPSHLQHLVIRVQRAKYQAEQGQGTEGLELLVRLRGRLDELEQGLAELEGNVVEGERKWSELRVEAQNVKEALEGELKSATSKIANAISTSSTSASNGRHSRSSSIELPRRLPSTLPALATPSDLDAFLSRLNSQTPSLPLPSLASRAQERAKTLSEAYSIFLLCTSPSSILPPDQTVSSIFRTAASRPPIQSVSTSLEYRLSTQAHRAYFDDLTNRLSSSITSEEQETGWRRTCRDLANACLPLIPSRLGGDTIKRQVEASLSPKPGKQWSIEASFATLRTILGVLRQLCAPARDDQISTLISNCSKIDGKTAADLVGVVKDTLKLAEEMQGDLERFRTNAKVALASDEEVSEVLREEAGERERKAIRGIVTGEIGQRVDVDGEIRTRTTAWNRRKRGTDGDQNDSVDVTKEAIMEALVDSLFEDQAVGPPPIRDDSTSFSPPLFDNSLPPIFWATSPRLFELQNTFQALTILACLTTVIPPPSTTTPRSSNPDQPDIFARLWTILKSEISSPATTNFDDSTPTRLAHLSDELIAYRRSLPPDPLDELEAQEKERIRNSVDRILRYQDPVFKLLRNRLRVGIKEDLIDGLKKRREETTTGGWTTTNQVPSNLRTGRDLASSSSRSKEARLSSLYHSSTTRTLSSHIRVKSIKGYERLMDRIDEPVEGRLTEVWDWVEEVWGDVLEWQC